MDLSFIRNQIELKLTEFESLNNLYIDGLEKEFRALEKIITKEQHLEISDLLEELKAYSDNSNEMKLEFGITVTQLTVYYSEIQNLLRSKVKAKK